jgi:NADPH:quinone reductase-like Zn-dependent oxidoreductase
LFRPKQQILGCDFAGVIEEVGRNVIDLKIGDKIFGFNDQHFGGHAEYMTVSKNNDIAHIPASASFAQAAAFSEGGHYALSNIRAAKVSSGQYVLVNGATGAIGSAAVQIAKHFGAKGTAVANTKNIELVKNLGADEMQ